VSEQSAIKQEERVLAGLAHGSVLLGPLTNGVGGIVTTLVVWLIQRDKSAYVAFQALQALVYQVVAFFFTGLVTCCWFAVWMLMWVPTMAATHRLTRTYRQRECGSVSPWRSSRSPCG